MCLRERSHFFKQQSIRNFIQFVLCGSNLGPPGLEANTQPTELVDLSCSKKMLNRYAEGEGGGEVGVRERNRERMSHLTLSSGWSVESLIY